MSLPAGTAHDSEIAAFKAALDNAGQPWSRIGVRTIGVGFIGCLLTLIGGSYVAFIFVERMAFFVASLTIIAAGWVFLIIAMVRRRQWSKVQALRMPPLSGSGPSGAQ